MNRNDFFDGIHGCIEQMEVFSDHDHHLKDDFFKDGLSLHKVLLNSYVEWTGYVGDIDTESSRKKLLDNSSFNTYFIWLEKGIRKLYGFDIPITLETWDRISGTIEETHRNNSMFHIDALKQAGYRHLLIDDYFDPGNDLGHPQIYTPVFRIDKFMHGFHAEAEAPDNFVPWKRYNFAGGTLDDYVDNMRETIFKYSKAGKVAAFKCAEAYHRNISFLPDDKISAQKAFGIHPDVISEEQRTAFSNYIFNRACEMAGELEVPFQIHSGLAELGGSHPLQLEPILIRYPKTRFVLFHSGYPWTDVTCGLIHNHPNALPSLTWTSIICTSAAVRTLHDYIDVAPSVNTITWGSDSWTAEEAAGALLSWQWVVAKVLAERIQDGRLNITKAEMLAAKLMSTNGKHVYGI